MTIAKLLKHDFTKGSLNLFDTNGNLTYYENSTGYWYKFEYDSNDNLTYSEDSAGYWSKYKFDSNGSETYFESSNGYWSKREYDSNGNVIYFENSTGTISDNRPKTNCSGKTVTIDGIEYELKAKK